MSTMAIASRLSTFRCKFKSMSPLVNNLFKSTSPSQASASAMRIPRLSRLPVEMSCLVGMFPLHSANASARLQSMLAVDSQSWCLVPQGISMPL